MSDKITREEKATMLGALRFYQNRVPSGVAMMSDEIWRITSDNGSFVPLSDAQVDELCEKLNFNDWQATS